MYIRGPSHPQNPPRLNIDTLLKMRDKIHKDIDEWIPVLKQVTNEDRLSQQIELKIQLILIQIKISIGGNARFFKVINDLK